MSAQSSSLPLMEGDIFLVSQPGGMSFPSSKPVTHPWEVQAKR